MPSQGTDDLSSNEGFLYVLFTGNFLSCAENSFLARKSRRSMPMRMTARAAAMAAHFRPSSAGLLGRVRASTLIRGVIDSTAHQIQKQYRKYNKSKRN
jgi:hypothetical protein